ncbi:hypothetical protein MHU86_14504 [Fragilaria crotonensis]|nr:hypothetical protein MHU86_14504 [Fragilaria crotonensis]
MMAAAQAAAEAAMRDAVNRERSSSNNHHQQQQPLQTDMARLLQMQTDRDADQATAAQELFREMMGFGGFQELGEDNVESLLQIMAQHSQVNQASHHEEDYEPEPQLPKNPSVHYMTIAEDGKDTEPPTLILTIISISNARFCNIAHRVRHDTGSHRNNNWISSGSSANDIMVRFSIRG